jgi:hypothetical protein
MAAVAFFATVATSSKWQVTARMHTNIYKKHLTKSEVAKP